MAKELYLYSPIYDFVAQDLIQAMDDNMSEDITLRLNTPGGSVFSNYGICAKMTEHGSVNVKVDGAAMSSGAYLLLFAKNVECLDVSTIVFHRADMPIENQTDQDFLDKINKDLKAKMLLKINADKFKEVTGYSINEMFNPETRLDITLSGKDAKKIGLVSKVTTLSPAEVTAFNNKMFAVSATSNPIETSKNKNMTIDKLKAEHPAVYAEILALGVAQEKDRVEACVAFIDIDPAGVKAAIESGKNLSQKQMADFTVKALSKESLAAIAKEAPGAVTTTEVTDKEKTDKQKSIEAFENSVNANLKIKTPA